MALGGLPSLRDAILGFSCGFFLSGSALVLNDYFDLEVDKVNAPQRALPSGAVSKSDVIALTCFATFLGLAASYFMGTLALAVSILFWFVGVLYNWRFKEKGISGNLMVASSVAITFVIGGIAVGDPWNRMVWFFSLIAFLIDLGEEIAGDAMDMEGDAVRGSKSIALLFGRHMALRISAGIFFLVVSLGFVPITLGWLERRYLVVMAIAGMVVGFQAIQLVRSKTPEEGRKVMRSLYLGPTLGLVVFIIGHFFN